ncbi:2-amino-4-hydroxy-6-hydroxymethyldihydropteridine diphosphokinase [bacterium]|nr:2-amino-4-hydroxy-6-hydroxymethyldihydropteridine diphosphokinase [bacterium]
MRVLLCLGSNRGDRLRLLKKAGDFIRDLPGMKILARSSVYETQARGMEDQRDFLNQVLEVETNMAPPDLLAACKKIESLLGRKTGARWGPRTMDIDILTCGDEVINRKDLVIPHPRLAERRFVLVPLTEIAPGLRVPVWDQTAAELLAFCSDKGRVVRYRARQSHFRRKNR